MASNKHEHVTSWLLFSLPRWWRWRRWLQRVPERQQQPQQLRHYCVLRCRLCSGQRMSQVLPSTTNRKRNCFILLRSQLYIWGSPSWARIWHVWQFSPLYNHSDGHIPSSWMVRVGCVFVAVIHPSRTWMSGFFESVRQNACVHKLDLGLYSHPIFVREIGSEPMSAAREKSPLQETHRTVKPATPHHAGQQAQHPSDWASTASKIDKDLFHFQGSLDNVLFHRTGSVDAVLRSWSFLQRLFFFFFFFYLIGSCNSGLLYPLALRAVATFILLALCTLSYFIFLPLWIVSYLIFLTFGQCLLSVYWLFG